MKQYTVIGVYPCGQRYVGHIEAFTPEQAALKADRGEDETGLEFVAVIEGYHSDVLGGSHVVFAEDLEKEEV